MPFDFPNSPTTNQTVVAPNGATFVWDGVKWTTGTGPTPGQFLPLTGGTVTGPLTVSGPNTVILTGGAAGSPASITTGGPWGDLDVAPALNGKLHFNLWRNYPAPDAQGELCRFDYAAQGTNSGQNYSAELHAVNGDTVTGGFSYFNFLGGPHAGATGGRTAFGVNFQPGGITNVGASNFYVGSAVFSSTAYNGGGASGATMGGFFASNDMALLYSGATWWEELCGYELDVGISTGASASYKHGMKINLWSNNAVAGAGGADTAYSTSSNNANSPTAGWDVVYAVGDGYGYWPVKTTGRIIGVVAGPGGGPARNAAWGVDFSTVTFSGGLIRGPGFTVNGSGGIDQGSANAPGSHDLSRHINLYGGSVGLAVTSGNTLNYNVPTGGGHNFFNGASFIGQISSVGLDFCPIGQANAASGSFTNLTATGTVSGVGFVNLLASAPFVPLAGGTMSQALHFSAVASGASDLTKHLDLHGGNTGFCVDSGGTLNTVFPAANNIWAAGGFIGQFTSTGLNNMAIGQTTPSYVTGIFFQVGSTTGPTWTTGSGAPASVQPVGSLYSRVSTWAAGATLYVSKGAGAWTAVASV